MMVLVTSLPLLFSLLYEERKRGAHLKAGSCELASQGGCHHKRACRGGGGVVRL